MRGRPSWTFLRLGGACTGKYGRVSTCEGLREEQRETQALTNQSCQDERTYCVSRVDVGGDVMRSLLFLLLVFLSLLANITGYDRRDDLRSDAEMSWPLDTAGKHLKDDIQKLSK